MSSQPFSDASPALLPAFNPTDFLEGYLTYFNALFSAQQAAIQSLFTWQGMTESLGREWWSEWAAYMAGGAPIDA